MQIGHKRSIMVELIRHLECPWIGWDEEDWTEGNKGSTGGRDSRGIGHEKAQPQHSHCSSCDSTTREGRQAGRRGGTQAAPSANHARCQTSHQFTGAATSDLDEWSRRLLSTQKDGRHEGRQQKDPKGRKSQSHKDWAPHMNFTPWPAMRRASLPCVASTGGPWHESISDVISLVLVPCLCLARLPLFCVSLLLWQPMFRCLSIPLANATCPHLPCIRAQLALWLPHVVLAPLPRAHLPYSPAMATCCLRHCTTLGYSSFRLSHGGLHNASALSLVHPFCCTTTWNPPPSLRPIVAAQSPPLQPSSYPRNPRSAVMAASVQGSEAPAKESEKCFGIPSGKTPLEMIYLEGNSWLWTLNGMNILVDPVLVGNLDFGIPFLYDAAKKSKLMKEFTLDDLPKLDCILITQGYDDHCHKNTLTAMVDKFSEVRVIASPNAEAIMGKIGFHNVTYLEPRDSTMLGDIHIRATEGPVLGPPWQRPESGYLGYFLEVPDPKFVLYYEPHCIFGKAGLEKEKADVIVTPVNKQVLPAYTLVSGQEDAVQLAKLLQPKYLVTMKNAELDSRGVLSLIVSEKGTVDTFKEMLTKEAPHCQVLEPKPGVPFEVPVLTLDSANSQN